MTGQAGRDVVLRLGNGANPEIYTAVAGIRTKRLTLSAGLVDATHAESVGRWRELITGAGTRSALVEGAGVFVDAASDARVRDIFFGTGMGAFQLAIPDFGEMTGSFQIEELSYGGDYDGEAVFSIRLLSAGPLVFTNPGDGA